MRHRHLNHEGFTSAAIDDVISRGSWHDWAELRRAALDDRAVLHRISRVCAAFAHDSTAQRHQFWRQFAESEVQRDPLRTSYLLDLLHSAGSASHDPMRGQDAEALSDFKALVGLGAPIVPAVGCLDGIETSVRKLVRSEQLELEAIQIDGRQVMIPSEAEVLRAWGVQILTRNRFDDYLGLAALAGSMGLELTAEAFAGFDRIYPLESALSALQQLLAQLAPPIPCDADEAGVQRTLHALRPMCAEFSAKIFAKVCFVGEFEHIQRALNEAFDIRDNDQHILIAAVLRNEGRVPEGVREQLSGRFHPDAFGFVEKLACERRDRDRVGQFV
ncbi:protein of unknown function [Thauera humireducens]|uniref:hypothetical protein n=1 Tax=Thauera humireducens TaxID=1134435 RepID=UPI002467A965|nr:hypothetical protein [Thauera humireducens]CAH1748155.1 protein of unknown function [Thauera humireducens]